MTLYRSLFGLGMVILDPHIVHWCIMISGSFFTSSSIGSKSVEAVTQPR